MISTTDFKRGKKILFQNEPYMVVDFMSVKPGKGGAYIKTKMKNMITGLMREETFRSGEKFQDPGLEYKDMQYLYNEDNIYHFMDTDSYEQYSFNKDQIEEALDFLKEQESYNIMYFQNKPIAVTPPMFMELRVTDAPPGVKGNTAQGGASKPITLETGVVINAPLFIQEGDILKIDTRTNEYIERINK
ncbi:MAG TPA: elongation factor P [Candidatus Saccharimonadales bacterium]|nr:elongation factor P [Candidatus Saccharimonadales bacterium]